MAEGDDIRSARRKKRRENRSAAFKNAKGPVTKNEKDQISDDAAKRKAKRQAARFAAIAKTRDSGAMSDRDIIMAKSARKRRDQE